MAAYVVFSKLLPIHHKVNLNNLTAPIDVLDVIEVAHEKNWKHEDSKQLRWMQQNCFEAIITVLYQLICQNHLGHIRNSLTSEFELIVVPVEGEKLLSTAQLSYFAIW
jgi:hypothetical protein